VATLFGMTPAPVTGCRTIELGCGDGSNLIPMAYHLPGSRFTGIDLAAEPIAAGQEMAAALGLSNLRLEAADLMDLGDIGEFDYVIAHGVYSWVPAPVRERLLAIATACLAPQGVAFISYNTFPGRYVRQMFRDMMLYHTRGIDEPAGRVEEARKFLKWLDEARAVAAPWAAMYQDEIRDLLAKPPDSLYHDDLAGIADPIYFRDFAEHARKHGLQYLGDADLHAMFDPLRRLDFVGDDVIEREQYRDFLTARRFRQTLLCRADVIVDRNPGPERMDNFYFSAPAHKVEDGSMEGKGGVRVTAPHEALERVTQAMGQCYPLPVAFEELVPYAGDAPVLRDILYALVTGGFADLHVFDFPCQETVTQQPAASRLVRYQAKRGRYVTSACHETLELDEAARRLVLMLDGTRAVAEEDRATIEWLARVGLLEA
jgi:methyltransferase-like protein